MPEPEDRELVEALLAECLALPEPARREGLEERCRVHPEQAEALRARYEARARFDPETAGALPERLGDFRLLERLGGGGMGVVHLAEQESLGRQVALKMIRPEHLHFEGARERFRREVAAVARLKHPSIIPIYTFGEQDGIPYFAMERVEGRSLAELLESLEGRPPHELTGEDLSRALGWDPDDPSADAPPFRGAWTKVAVHLVRQIAGALAHAHENGIVHRDVKPSNIIVTPRGRALLFDFGVAGACGTADRMTPSGTVVGSLPYLAPEAAAGRVIDADPRLDIYALGVTLYELLTLTLPYRADTTDVLLRRIIDGAATPPSDIHLHLSWDVESVCLTAMDVDPARRYASAEALERDLDNLLAFRPIDAQQPPAPLRVRRWVQRRPTLATAIGLGFLLVFVAPSIALLKIRAERDGTAREAAVAKGVSEFLMSALRTTAPPGPTEPDLTLREFVARLRLELRRLEADPVTKTALLCHLAEVSVALGDVEEARPLLEEASTLCDSPSVPPLHRAAIERAYAAVAFARGDDTEARRRLQAALAVYDSLGLGDEPAARALRAKLASLSRRNEQK